MRAPLTLPLGRRPRDLRDVDLAFFAEGGASSFALAGFSAAPMMTAAVEVHIDLSFAVTRDRVRFWRQHRFVRESDCRGEPDDAVAAYLMPAIEDGFVVDMVAWHPRTGRIATQDGRAGLLGGDALWSAVDEPVVVAPDPRAWLAGWRRGVCIVDEALARPALLEAGVDLVASDVAHGERLDAMLRKVRVPKILVPETPAVRVAA